MRPQRFDPLPYFALMLGCLFLIKVVFCVPLQSNQHAALMALYEGLGKFLLNFVEVAL